MSDEQTGPGTAGIGRGGLCPGLLSVAHGGLHKMALCRCVSMIESQSSQVRFKNNFLCRMLYFFKDFFFKVEFPMGAPFLQNYIYGDPK